MVYFGYYSSIGARIEKNPFVRLVIMFVDVEILKTECPSIDEGLGFVSC